MYDICVVYSTFSSEEEAKSCARHLLNEKLVGCVNILPGITSLYVWEGQLCETKETAALFKTTPDQVTAMMLRLKELHSYTTPAMINLTGGQAEQKYAEWLSHYVKKKDENGAGCGI